MKDDAELVAAALAGEEDAFTALYQAHVGYVRAVGRSILRTEELDDLCQETFLLAFTRLPSFEGNAGFRTWVTRIAINQCLMLLRRGRQGSNGDSKLVQMDFERAENDVLFSTTDVDLEGVPARVDVDKLLGSLKPIPRKVLEMACLEDISDGEIAESMGMALGTVKRILARAKQRLRRLNVNR